MKKLLLLLLFVTSYSFAQQAYYSDVDLTKTGLDLRNELATKVISTHTSFLTYSESYTVIKMTDEDPNNNNNVILLYNGISESKDLTVGGGNTGSEIWNREHTYPKSLGDPDLGTSGPGSDVHQLRACDQNVNSNRGNLKFINGSGSYSDSGSGWYPGDEWKGDVARMMMYMYLRYGNQCYPTGVTIGTANDIDSNMINLLLDWNAQDPVSAIEDQRNTILETAQGNRNPFIDNPNLATQIWGGSVAVNRWNTTDPTAPTNLAASNITNTTVDLTWTASTDDVGVTSYDIFVNGSLYTTTANISTTLTGLTINTNYDITVYANDADGNTSFVSNTVNINTDTEDPTAPTNLAASNITNTTVDLTWTASTDDGGVTSYDLFVKGSLYTTTANTSTTLTGLTINTNYDITAYAKDDAGNTSLESNTESIKTTNIITNSCGSETFTNSNAPSNNSYSDDSFIGDNGVIWTYVESRDEDITPITGIGLMLRNTSSKLTSSTVSNGIGDFTCSLLKGFTGVGDRQVSLYVNGDLEGTSILWDNTTVQTFTVSGINISGDVIVEIRNEKNEQVVIDDISWTCYTTSSNTSELFISEYVEGGGNNKAIEIANFSGNTVDLSDYSLKRDVNGGGWGAALNLSGYFLSNENVFVVANSSASPEILTIADLPSTADALKYNGDDAVGLFKNNILIDIVGVRGNTPLADFEDKTLRRTPTISSPNTTYTASEWNVYAKDDITDLGSHTLSALSVQKFVKDLFSVYPNPTTNNKITIKTNGDRNINKIQIFNLVGQLVLEKRNPSTSNSTINLEGIPKGIYIIKIQNENAFSTKKLIIE